MSFSPWKITHTTVDHNTCGTQKLDNVKLYTRISFLYSGIELAVSRI